MGTEASGAAFTRSRSQRAGSEPQHLWQHVSRFSQLHAGGSKYQALFFQATVPHRRGLGDAGWEDKGKSCCGLHVTACCVVVPLISPWPSSGLSSGARLGPSDVAAPAMPSSAERSET